MPGLFDNTNGIGANGGLLGLLTGQGAGPGGLAGSIDPERRALAQQQQAQQATFNALLPLVGGNRDLAAAAALQPEILKQIAPELNQAPHYQKLGTDPFTGMDIPGLYRGGPNPSLSIMPIQGQGGSSAGGGGSAASDFQAAVNNGVQGEDLYEHLPKDKANFVRAIVEGRQAISPMMLRPGSPMYPLIDAAHTIDPTLDMANPAARQKAMTDAKSGTVAQSQRGINQTIHHIVTKLIPAAEFTGNKSFVPFNQAKNTIADMFGQTNTTAFYPTAVAVADEMSRAFKGNHMSDAQINEWKHSLNGNMSPDQQKMAVDTLLGLLQGAADSAHEQRVQGIGSINDAKMGPMIHDQGQKELESIKSWIGNKGLPTLEQQTAAKSGAAPGIPKPGDIMKGYRFKGGNPADQNSWERTQ